MTTLTPTVAGSPSIESPTPFNTRTARRRALLSVISGAILGVMDRTMLVISLVFAVGDAYLTRMTVRCWNRSDWPVPARLEAGLSGWVWRGTIPATCVTIWGFVAVGLPLAVFGSQHLDPVLTLLVLVGGVVALAGFVVMMGVQLDGRPWWAIPPRLRSERASWHGG